MPLILFPANEINSESILVFILASMKKCWVVIYSEIISKRNLYGLGVDPHNDEIYVADAVAFQGNGKVYTYDFSGNKLDEYSVGRGPRDFVFMNQ